MSRWGLKEENEMNEMSSFIQGMPKAELHVHLEGTLEPELKFELARRNGVNLPYGSAADMQAAYAFHDLSSFLAVYYEGMSVLQAEPDFYDLAMAYFRKAHSQNVVYAEVFFDPQAHTTRGIAFETVIDGLHRAQQEAAAELGLRTQLIMCFLRDMSTDSAMQTLEQSLPHRDWIAGVGLDSDEKGNPPIKFKEVFGRARSEGYHLTMHCDVDQENSVTHIWQCLNDIGVERIDHGVNCLEDDTLVQKLKSSGVGLTICPISNNYVSDGLKAREIKVMLERSLLVTVNSDDPAYFPGYINENLVSVAAAASLTNEDVLQIARNALTIAWIGEEDRGRYLHDLGAYAASRQP
jgi:adenosine deaminase